MIPAPRPLSRSGGLAHAGGLITGSRTGTRLLKDWEYASDFQQRQQRLQYRKLARSRSGTALEIASPSASPPAGYQAFVMTRGPLAPELSEGSMSYTLPPAKPDPEGGSFEELRQRCLVLFEELDTSGIGVITIGALETSFDRLHSRPPVLRMTRELFERYVEEIFPSEAKLAQQRLDDAKDKALEALNRSLFPEDFEDERQLENAKNKALAALQEAMFSDEEKLDNAKAQALEALKNAFKVSDAAPAEPQEALPEGEPGVTLEKFIEFHRHVWENQPLAVRCPRGGVAEMFNSELMVRKAFSHYDKDMSGKVQAEELPSVLQDLGLLLNNADRDRVDKFYEGEFEGKGAGGRLTFHDFVRFNNQYVSRLEATQGSQLMPPRTPQARSLKLSSSAPSLKLGATR